MKTLSLALLLMASLALVLLACSDNSNSLVNSSEQPVTSMNTPPSLAKRGPVVAAVNGSGNVLYDDSYEGKQVFGTFTITAHKYADGSYDGEYTFNDHVVDWKSFNKFHGKVLFLKVYGNQVLVGGQEMTGEVFKDWYDAFLLTDNGQGNNAQTPDIRSRIYSDLPTNYETIRDNVWTMTPEQFIQTMETTWYPGQNAQFEVTRGNIQIWQVE